MKRIITILLIGILTMSLLVLAACQGPTDTSSDLPDVPTKAITMDPIETDPLPEEAEQDSDIVIYEPMSVPETYREDVAIAYQIFPIAYADSTGNGIGDLQGIIGQLDYLKNDLNVDMIWLNPIHPSPSYHKYDVTDYYDIDPTFGTLEDYQMLIDAAHERGIKVLLDFVINHTASSHPWFINAKTGPDATYRDYYVWHDFSDDSYPGKQGWYSVPGDAELYFASFWSEMPELNFENPEVRSIIKDIAQYWLEMGVDGFRIDAAKHIYDLYEYPKGTPVLQHNLDWFLEFNHFMKSVNPDAFLLLEMWDGHQSVRHYLTGSDSAFNFDLSDAIISAVTSENRKNLQGRFNRIETAYEGVTKDFVDSVFLANHDQNRIMTQLGNSDEKARLAASIQMTLPGISWIYYGEEIGMTGAKPDEDIREGMKWTDDQSQMPNSRWRSWQFALEIPSLETQKADDTSLFALYEALTTLKSQDNVIRHGAYVDYEIGSSFRVFAFFRHQEDQTYLILHNLHSEAKTFTLSEAALSQVFSTTGSLVTGTEVVLEPYGSLVIEVSDVTVTAEATN